MQSVFTKMGMPKRQMQKICRKTHIKDKKSPVCEVNSTNTAKRSVELSELGFDSMDIFHYQSDDIHRFMGIPADKKFSCSP